MKQAAVWSVVAAMAMVGATVWAGAAPASLSTIPEYINYQGRLVSPSGIPYSNTTHIVELRLYDQPGTVLWGETYTFKTQDGYFSILMGSGGVKLTGLTNSLWQVKWKASPSTTDNYYLGVKVLTDTNGVALASPAEASPRQQFLSAPFAYRAHQSVYASKAADPFDAQQGLMTPSLSYTGTAVSLNVDLRFNTTGTLYANNVKGFGGGNLYVLSDTAGDLDLVGGNTTYVGARPVRFGSGPILGYSFSSNVVVGIKEPGGILGGAGTLTTLQGHDVNIGAQYSVNLNAGNNLNLWGNGIIAEGNDVTIDATYELNMHASGPATLASDNGVGIQSGQRMTYNSRPLFIYTTVFVNVSPASGGLVSSGNAATGIDTSLYTPIVSGWSGSLSMRAPSSVYVQTDGKVWVLYDSNYSVTVAVRVLGVNKGLIQQL